MKTNRFGKPALIIAALIQLLLVSAGIFLIRFGLEPQHDFNKNSLAYFLLLDGEIANVPWGQQQGEAHFTSIAQNGTAPAIDSAALAVPNLVLAKEAVQKYLTQLGYLEQTRCEPACATVWAKGDATINVYAEKNRLIVVKSLLISK